MAGEQAILSHNIQAAAVAGGAGSSGAARPGGQEGSSDGGGACGGQMATTDSRWSRVSTLSGVENHQACKVMVRKAQKAAQHQAGRQAGEDRQEALRRATV